ncbi:jg1896, partial [Pararge aegeria aegeria]
LNSNFVYNVLKVSLTDFGRGGQAPEKFSLTLIVGWGGRSNTTGKRPTSKRALRDMVVNHRQFPNSGLVLRIS